MTDARAATSGGRPRARERAGAWMRIAVGIPMLVLFFVAFVAAFVWIGVNFVEDGSQAAGVAVAFFLAALGGLMIFVACMTVNVRHLLLLRRRRDALALRPTEESLARRTAEEVRALQMAEGLLLTRRRARGAVVAALVIAAVAIVAAVVLATIGSAAVAGLVVVLTIIHSVLILPFALWTMAGVGATFRG